MKAKCHFSLLGILPNSKINFVAGTCKRLDCTLFCLVLVAETRGA